MRGAEYDMGCQILHMVYGMAKNKEEPQSVGDILARLKRSTQVGKQLDQARIWERWPEIAGPLAGHGQPRTIKDNVLYIEAESTVWMHKFAYHKWDIINRINRLTGNELVDEVFLVLADDPSPELPEE